MMDCNGSGKKSEEIAYTVVENQENADCDKERIESDCSLSMCGDIKSTAVVKFSAVEPPTRYMQLSSNTNLNQPPSNWLRGTAKLQGKWGEWTYRSSHDKIFTSFHLANNFTDCVGKVDVISDAENIKKLLKIPYGKSHISMMVHRVGKTLLLDEFDIHKHLLRASQKQFEWLRKFYFEHVLQSQEVEHPMLRKRKSRGYLQNRNMFSKFLYYSLDDSNDLGKETSNVCDDQRDQSKVGCDSSLRHSSENPVQPLVPDILKETEEHIESGSHEFLRNVLWTFEDIRMLIGSDLLIFGDEEYPAVSLKLRDMEKPISVLTGLDYWLDNLMCNVPEVVMCFHVNGIVQKYELIKTEDIPQMKNSQFSPQVVKDIAQNILSFLKSNATKSGHTYWLFKGKNDDVVKLYDLTTLCADVMDENDQNPFKLPVAMLLYRVACNIKESQDGPRKQGTIYQLLTNCLCLLSKNESPQITTSVHYLLSEVYVPSGVNPMSVHGNCPSDESDSEDEKNDYDEDEKNDYDDHEDEADNLSSFPTDIDFESPSVSVNSLCRPKKCTEVFSGLDKTIPPLSKNWEERCIAALGHIVEGLKCVVNVEDSEEEQLECSDSANCANDSPLYFKAREEKIKVAKPYQAIPLNYSPINSQNSKEQDSNMKSGNSDMTDSQSSAFESESVPSPSWKLCCKILLLQKASQTYCALAEIANSNKRYGAALRFIKLGLLCYEHTPKFVASHCSKWLTEPLAYLLSLAGDALFMIYHRDFGNNDTSHQRDYESSGDLDLDIINIMKKNFGELHFNTLDYSWAWSWPSDFESSLSHSSRAYEVALKVWPEKLIEGKESLKKRYGNILNELGVWYMNQAIEMLKDNTSKGSKGKINEKFLHLLNKSFKSLENGIVYFESVNDIANQALLNSNIGRLMRITAHAWAPYTVEGLRKEFSSQEKHYFNKAINYYNRAAYILGDTKNLPEIRDTVNWELSGTLFNFACLLQDYAPLSSYAQEQVEREVSELMMKALKLGEADHPPQKIPLYQYRAAKIHHKLGSLYHNAFRNQANEDHRRRQMRTLADMHYSKSSAIFSTLEHCNEFLIILMERIGLWEHHLTGLSGFGSKLKAFYSIINCMISAKPILQSLIKASYINKLNENAVLEPVNSQDHNNMPQFLISEDDEEKEQQKLLDIFHQRLQLAIIGLVKLFSTKSNRNEKELKQWREISAFLSKYSVEDNLIQHVCSVLEQLEDIVLQRS